MQHELIPPHANIEFRHDMDHNAKNIYVDGVYIGYIEWHDGLKNFRIHIKADDPLINLPLFFLEAVLRQRDLIVAQAQTR